MKSTIPKAKSGTATIDVAALRPLSDVYSDIGHFSSCFAVFREIPSNSFQWGYLDNAGKVDIKWDGIMLSFEDYGIGCERGQEEKFFGINVGKPNNHPSFNKWGIGMRCLAMVASEVNITVARENVTKDKVFGVRWFGDYLSKWEHSTPVAKEGTGVLIEAHILPEFRNMFTLTQIRNVLKLYWYWKIRHQNCKVIFNGEEIKYDDIDKPQATWYKSKELLTGLEAEGEIYLDLESSRPSWVGDKNSAVIYEDGNCVSADREFMGSINGLVFVNDCTLLAKLQSGKTIKDLRKTGFYQKLQQVITKKYLKQETLEKNWEQLINNVLKSMVKTDTNDGHRYGKRGAGEFMDKITRKGEERGEYKHHSYPIQDVKNPEKPFFYPELAQGSWIIYTNKAYYPKLTELINKSVKGSIDSSLYYFASRLAYAIRDKKRFAKTQTRFLDEWKEMDYLQNKKLEGIHPGRKSGGT